MNVAVLESLIVAAHHLTQLAAHATGDKTPAATWRTLSVLQHNGPQRVGTLAALSRVTQPGMTRLIGTMHEEHLVEKVADAADSRVSVVTITRSGRSALEQWRHTIARAMEPAFGSLADDEWNILARAAEILTSRTVAGVTS